MLDLLWDWGKEKLTTEELSNNLFLNKENKKRKKENAWQVAGIMGNTVLLAKIWNWAKVNKTTDELKNELPLVKDDPKELRGRWQQSGENGVRRENMGIV